MNVARFHLSCLELRGEDGTVCRVPWDDVHIGGVRLSPSKHYRRVHSGAAVSVRASRRAREVARRLVVRAKFHRLDAPLDCPTAARAAGAASLSSLAMLACVAASWLTRTWGERHGTTNPVTVPMPADVQWATVAVITLGIVGIAAFASVPLFTVWPYVRFRLRHPRLAALRVSCDGILRTDADGTTTRYDWRDLRSFTRSGRLVFGQRAGGYERVVQLYPQGRSRGPWPFVYDRLRHARRAAAETSAIEVRSQARRARWTGLIATGAGVLVLLFFSCVFEVEELWIGLLAVLVCGGYVSVTLPHMVRQANDPLPGRAHRTRARRQTGAARASHRFIRPG
jgi:hypothetical protein